MDVTASLRVVFRGRLAWAGIPVDGQLIAGVGGTPSAELSWFQPFCQGQSYGEALTGRDYCGLPGS